MAEGAKTPAESISSSSADQVGKDEEQSMDAIQTEADGESHTGTRGPRVELTDTSNCHSSSKTSTASQDSLAYDMNYFKSGAVTIINVEQFDQEIKRLSNRAGSEIDVENLKTTFESINMDVEVFDGPTTKREINDHLKTCAANNYSNYAMFVCVVMSHGTKEKVYTSDGKIKINKIIETIEKSKSLKNKPKIFIFQACRGKKENRPTHTQYDGPRFEAETMTVTRTVPVVKPDFADCLIIHSTIPDFKAYRNTAAGSWFIQDFCHVIREYSKQDEVCLLLTRATSAMCGRQTAGEMQISSYTSTLTKQLYLTKEAYEKIHQKR